MLTMEGRDYYKFMMRRWMQNVHNSAVKGGMERMRCNLMKMKRKEYFLFVDVGKTKISPNAVLLIERKSFQTGC